MIKQLYAKLGTLIRIFWSIMYPVYFFNYLVGKYVYSVKNGLEKLLSNAKIPENRIEKIIGIDLTGYGAQGIHCMTDINGHQIRG